MTTKTIINAIMQPLR